ncbi:4571_t:CDS:2, partial [Paraglomus occultum]
MKEMARKAIGKKGDGYVQLFDGTAKDLAATEAGAQWKGAKGTKLMVESLGKLPKVLRDIWMSNVQRAGGDVHVLRSLAVPGLAIYGPMVAFLLLDSPKGYITRCFVNDWRELSMTVSKETLKANGRVFLDFLLTRLHVLRNEDLIVGNAKSSEGEDENEDPGLALLQEFSSPKRRAPLAMPLSHPTPKRRKVPGNACERRPSASGSDM